MQNGEAPDAAAAKPAEEVTKQSMRSKVWKHLETNGLAVFPRPVYHRIPNFKGAPEAAAKLAELDVFKNATNIRVNPDKPQESVRIKCLEQKKTLYVPATRRQPGYLSRIELPEGKMELRKAISKRVMEDYGKSIDIEEAVPLDIVVVGSVAVSKEGYRIGKGRGYSDLEFGLMVHMKSIQPSTVVVTTVHDSQVFDTLPAELFGPHDVPVDIIVTPTQVIETQRMSQRPPGLLWHLLSKRRVEQMSVLGKLRDMEIEAGRPCPLKEVDTDMEEVAAPRVRRPRRRTRSHHRSQSDAEKDEGNTTEGEQGEGKPRRAPRRRNSHKSGSGKDGDTPTKPRKPRKPRADIVFSLKVSNISPNARLRDLKVALTERGVKPQIMVWKGFRGYCYLHFTKPNAHKQQGEGDGVAASPPNMDSVLSALKDMSITEQGGEGEAPVKPYSLLVEPAPPRPPPKQADAVVVVAPTADVTAV